MFILQIISKKGIIFSPRVQGKSHKITHISSSSLIFRALVFLFAQCMRLRLFFPPGHHLSGKSIHSTEQLCWGTPAPPSSSPALLSSISCRRWENSWKERESAVLAPKTQIEIHDEWTTHLAYHQELFFQSSKSNSRQGSLLSKMVASLQVPR